jgi:hypothetical protein
MFNVPCSMLHASQDLKICCILAASLRREH